MRDVTDRYLLGAAPWCACAREVDPVLGAVHAEAVVGHAELRAVILIAAMACRTLVQYMRRCMQGLSTGR